MLPFPKYPMCWLAAISLWAVSCQTPPAREAEKLAWLKSSAVPVRSIEPADADYTDLQFLKTELKDVEVIGLGEQSHGDGSTFLAKSRLIRFLQQEMGFRVLAFESGMLDGVLALQALENGAPVDSAFRLAMFKIWSHSRQVGALRRYAGQTPSPFALPFVGFDCQFSGNLDAARRRDSIVQFFRRYEPGFDTARYTLVWRAMTARGRKGQIRGDSLLQQRFFTEMDTLAGKIRRFALRNARDSMLARGFMELKDFFYFTWKINWNNPDPAIANIRDSVMAENVIWIKEQLFPGQKIILWAANTHLGYRRELLKYPDGMIPMGDFLKKRYGDRYYTLSFTSRNGSFNSLQGGVKKAPAVSNKSLEYLLGQAAAPYAYLRKKDLATIPFENPFQARLYGYTNWYADWPKMTDGIFFISTMLPSEIEP